MLPAFDNEPGVLLPVVRAMVPVEPELAVPEVNVVLPEPTPPLAVRIVAAPESPKVLAPVRRLTLPPRGAEEEDNRRPLPAAPLLVVSPATASTPPPRFPLEPLIMMAPPFPF
jgi:hypothetical protein